MNDNRRDCLASILGGLRRTAHWREQRIAARFPNDARNIAAVGTLRRIAAQFEALTDSEWATLQDHFSWQSTPWINALNEACRKVGFTSSILDRDSFVLALIDALGCRVSDR